VHCVVVGVTVAAHADDDVHGQCIIDCKFADVMIRYRHR
jgi:hypothetical protein